MLRLSFPFGVGGEGSSAFGVVHSCLAEVKERERACEMVKAKRIKKEVKREASTLDASLCYLTLCAAQYIEVRDPSMLFPGSASRLIRNQ